jgi:SAM-dependent methyltransferase
LFMAEAAVDYDHEGTRGLHTVSGAKAAFAQIFAAGSPESVLDVGCGVGTWLRAASDCGAREIFGVDGVEISSDLFVVPRESIKIVDLNEPLSLGRRFDLVISLEVAEHLEPENAHIIVDTLTRHGDTILFAAAAPGQAGIHHVNCQWPSYWQSKFNERGFACSDEVRWKLWEDSSIEPWYRQNMMMVTKSASAGQEPRLRNVIHPDCLYLFADTLQTHSLKGALRSAIKRRLPTKLGGIR